MEPELTPLQKQYINNATNYMLKYKMSQKDYDFYLSNFEKNVKNVNIYKNQQKQLTTLYDNFKSDIDKLQKDITSKKQGTSKIHDELELQKMLRGEEERKKTQEERNVDSLIRQYYEQNALKGVLLGIF